MTENGVVAVSRARTGPSRVGRGAAPRLRLGGRRAAAARPGAGAAIDGGRARTLASSATTTAVATGRAPRGAHGRVHQPNRSLTMCRRGTPARRRLARVASVIAGGPQT